MDAAEIKGILNDTVGKMNISFVHGAPKPGQTIPLQVGPLPSPIAFPVVSEQVIKVEEVTKQVTFESSAWPQWSKLTDEVIKLPPGAGTLANAATQGTIGRMEIRVPKVDLKNVPISVNVSWSLYNDATCTQVKQNLGTGTDITLSLIPKFAEWTDTLLPSGMLEYVGATIELSATPPGLATLTSNSVKRCIEVVVPPIALPSVLVLFHNGALDGNLLVVVPANSPLKGAGATSDIANALSAIKTSVAGPIAVAGTIAPVLSNLTWLVGKLNGADVGRVAVADTVEDLSAIKMWAIPGVLGFTAWQTAQDFAGSLFLISGNSTKKVRLYNRAGYKEWGDALHDGGAFTIAAGADHYSYIEDSATKQPQSAPTNTVSDITQPLGASTFYRKISSLEWI